MLGKSWQAWRESLNKPDWSSRALHALVSPEPLPAERCLQACAAVGGMLVVAATLALTFAVPPVEWLRVIHVQAVLGIVFVLGAAASWLWPSFRRSYLFAMGLVFVALVLLYPVWMFRVMTDQGGPRVTRFSHAPGVLALGLAFGVRLLLEFGPMDERMRRKVARPAGIGGLVLGGCLDLLVLYWMMAMFFRFGRQVEP